MENNDDEQENNKKDDDEDPDEGEQDSDEEDWASSKLGGASHRQVSHLTCSFHSVAMPKKQKKIIVVVMNK